MDEDAKKIRTSLMAMSLYLILYWLADGDIGPAGEVKIGTISFGNTDWIKVAGVLIFSYLFWRYHINGKLAYNEFKADIYLKLTANSEYINYVAECDSVRKSLKQKALVQLDEDKKIWPQLICDKNEPTNNVLRMPPLPIGYFDPSIAYASMSGQGAIAWVGRVNIVKNTRAKNENQKVCLLTPGERRAVRKFIVKAFKESLQTSNDFYQIVVPYIMAAFAVFSLMANVSLVLALTILTIMVVCAVISLKGAVRA